MKLLYKLIFLFGFVFLQAQNYYFSSPQGFGSNTTGGGSIAPITVTTWSDLRTQMQSSGAKVILVSGVITVPQGQQLRATMTNKTLVGLPGAKLISNTLAHPGGGIIYLRPNSNNIIIRNIVFEGPGAYDIDGEDLLTADGCTNLWVDHCEFQDGLDGNFDIKGLSDNITVSWCKFVYLKPPVPGGSGGSNDHRFSNLVGSSATDFPADGNYSVTFQNCFWGTGCKSRMPRGRNAQLHIINCLYKVFTSSSVAISLGGGANNSNAWMQNCNFASVTTKYSFASGDGGTATINFTNCLSAPSNIGVVNPPSFTYDLVPVNQVDALLSDTNCGAGATLQVTTNGIISSSTCSLSTIDSQREEIVVFPNPFQDKLQINFPAPLNIDTKVSVYSILGQLMYQSNRHETEVLLLDTKTWNSGVYILYFHDIEQIKQYKIIKK